MKKTRQPERAHFVARAWWGPERLTRAALLTERGRSGDIERLSASLSTAKVDLNPHQVDAALFAIQSPLSQGVILADEVGLGKPRAATIVKICPAGSARKIECGQAHFDALGVDYKVVTSHNEI
jgi:hypothetical protein